VVFRRLYRRARPVWPQAQQSQVTIWYVAKSHFLSHHSLLQTRPLCPVRFNSTVFFVSLSPLHSCPLRLADWSVPCQGYENQSLGSSSFGPILCYTKYATRIPRSPLSTAPACTRDLHGEKCGPSTPALPQDVPFRGVAGIPMYCTSKHRDRELGTTEQNLHGPHASQASKETGNGTPAPPPTPVPSFRVPVLLVGHPGASHRNNPPIMQDPRVAIC
jgi:hypothetical protein